MKVKNNFSSEQYFDILAEFAQYQPVNIDSKFYRKILKLAPGH